MSVELTDELSTEGDGDDHTVDPELLALHVQIEDLGMTPAAFGALFSEEQ